MAMFAAVAFQRGDIEIGGCISDYIDRVTKQPGSPLANTLCLREVKWVKLREEGQKAKRSRSAGALMVSNWQCSNEMIELHLSLLYSNSRGG